MEDQLKRQAELQRELQRLQQRVAELEERLAVQAAPEEPAPKAQTDYRDILECIPVPVGISRRSDGLILYGNRALAAAMGRPIDQLIGRYGREFLCNPQEREDLQDLLAQDRALRNYALQIKTLDGKCRWTVISVQPGELEGQQVLFSAFADITDRRRIEEELRHSEARFRRLAEASFEGVVIHEHGRVIDANQVFASLFGYELHEIIGMPILEFSVPECRSVVEEKIRSGNEQPYEGIGLRKDGSTFAYEVCGKQIPYAERLVRVSAVRDITLRKQAEQAQLAVERALLETQKLESLGVLAGGIAHDFNNLLVSMLGNASLALLDLPSDSPAREPIADLESAAHRAAELTQQLLAYVGRASTAIQSVDLRLLVEDLQPLLRTTVSRHIALHFAPCEQLPPIEADPGQIRRVIINLVANASEAIGEALGEISLRFVEQVLDAAALAQATLGANLAPGRYVGLRISDTGSGIPDEVRSRVFEPFFSTKFTGRGLGLAVVQGILRSHRGVLLLDSAPGRGTTFTVLFPAAAQPAAAVRPRPALQQLSGTALVIDDEPNVRLSLGRMLERLGLTVLLAGDGREGLSLLRRHAGAVCCVILDITMPHMTSEQVLQALRSVDARIPVVLMSGYSEQEISSRFSHEHQLTFLQKPFTLAELGATLASVL